MVSAPETNWMSRHSRPASFSAASAAATPYSTKLRPHLPHGCIPTPRTTTSLMGRSAPPSRPSGQGSAPLRASRSYRPPLPHDVLVVVVLVQRPQLELDVGADRQLGRVDSVGE